MQYHIWLRGHSALGRLLDRSELWPDTSDAWYQVAKAWAQENPEQGAISEDPDVCTVFTTSYRLLALDLDDPRIADGLRITIDLLRRMKEIADGANTHLMILLIPTKETVYEEAALAGSGGENPTFRRLIDMERRARLELTVACKEEEIAYVDTLPHLARALEEKHRIYPSDTEGHPLAAGYSVLASACYEGLRNLGWLKTF